ncbi:MAG: hypothetical protein M3383_01090 [Actinomycetota bacterium]|nr:hypothetical protein [Actinomycetota bacterium]
MTENERDDVDASGRGDFFRVLVVAADEHIGLPLEREIARRAGGKKPEIRVVVPALAKTAFQHAAGEVDEGRERAQHQLETSMEEIREAGLDGEGQVGDSDPMLAIDDALFGFPADEIIVVTHGEDDALWMEDDLFEKASKRFEPPMTSFIVQDNEVRRAGASEEGADHSSRGEIDPESRNLPRLAPRDVFGVVFAVLGSLALWIIATSGSDDGGTGFDTEALLIAGGFTLINLAHVVGLLLFESVGYRGIAERMFANLSLYGTALAIAVSLVLTLA